MPLVSKAVNHSIAVTNSRVLVCSAGDRDQIGWDEAFFVICAQSAWCIIIPQSKSNKGLPLALNKPKGGGNNGDTYMLQVSVRDNNVDQALRVMKKKMQREGMFREMRAKEFYEKPSVKKAKAKKEAIKRIKKLARKKAEREG